MRQYSYSVMRFGIATLLVFGLCSCSRIKSGPKDLNVVCIVIDTLRADHLPMYGHERDTAPFMNQLAEEGVVFENTYAPSSWTAPSTASLFTSLYPYQHGVVTGMKASKKRKINLNRIPEEIETLGDLFKRGGYATYAVTDNRNIAEEEGFTQGFDRFENFHYEGADVLNGKIIEWKEEMLGNDKYFLYIHYMEPHAPLHEREPWYSEAVKTSPEKIAAYDSEINYVDDHIRQLYEALNWDSDTLVIITADHGQEFHDHGGFGRGRTLYAEVINVPFIVYSSHDELDLQAGRLGDRISLVDILPTFADVIGLTPESHHEGISLVPLLTGEQEEIEERALYSHLLKKALSDEAREIRRAKRQKKRGKEKKERKNRPAREAKTSQKEIHAVIRDDWKCIERVGAPTELYSLNEDPGNQSDLAAKQPDLTTTLADDMNLFVKTCKKYDPSSTVVTLTEKEMERLRSLGYVR